MPIKHANDNVGKPVISLSACSIQGRRDHMEDYFDVAYQLKDCDQPNSNDLPYDYFYFGIFDGHGGHEAAEFAKKNLCKSIVDSKDFWSEDDHDVMRAIREGYAKTQAAMRKEMPKWFKTGKFLPSTAGTTASVLFIKNGKFYTGHVGDSRIIISKEHPETKQWISDDLTEDHKPENPSEVRRIERAGGAVKTKIGIHRVVWSRPVLANDLTDKLRNIYGAKETDGDDANLKQLTSSYPIDESLVESYQRVPFLSIARSLGDFWSINPMSGLNIVSPEPDVACRPITSDDNCILLASDGLWNVVKSQQAIRFLQELDTVKSRDNRGEIDEYLTYDNYYDVAGPKSQNHAMSLVYIAYQIWERRCLRADNITVVTAKLNDISKLLHKTHTNDSNQKYTMRRRSPERIKQDVQLDQSIVNKTREQPVALVLDYGNCFHHDVTLQTPDLSSSQDLTEGLEAKLRTHLVLPPTLLDPEIAHIGTPKNYQRISEAFWRKVDGTRIYMKYASDDPADSEERPTRLSKSGKTVKDASAQATQSMHDFGQPWSQLDRDRYSEVDDKSILKLRCLMNQDSPAAAVVPIATRCSQRKATLTSMSENIDKRKKTNGNESQRCKRRKSDHVVCTVCTI